MQLSLPAVYLNIRRFLFLRRWIWLGELDSCSCFLAVGRLHFDCKSVVTIKCLRNLFDCTFLGMTGTAIALIASAVFFALAVVCAVILVKCGVVPCCQKTASTKLTEDTTLSEQSAPLKGVDSCGKESIL